MRKAFDFTMGADPEFNIITQGRKVDAAGTLRTLLGKHKGFTADSRDGMGYKVGTSGALGWDGHSSTGEVRPSPSKTADGLVANLKDIFKKFTEACPLFDMSTLSYFGSVGGHIHFLVPKEMRTEQKIANIHKKMASLYLPLMMSENKINLQMRQRGGYGKISDFRPQMYDKKISEYNGYEFRAPSAEWLTTKKIALSTLAYAGTIYNEIINHPESIKKISSVFFKTEKQAEALQMLAMSDYESLTIALFKKIKKAVKKFEFYPIYKEEIDYILDTEKVIADKQKAAYNIVNGWGLRDEMETPTKKVLLNTKSLKDKLSKLDMDTIDSIVNIAYNNDTNVELYKKAIVERTAVYNWKLKNTYCLFGIKKGVNEYLVFGDNGIMYKGKGCINTAEDRTYINQLYNKIDGKFRYNDASSGIYRAGNREIQMMIAGINPEKESMKKIFIGIPYDARIKQDIKDFISIVYDIENGIDMVGEKINDIAIKAPIVSTSKDGETTQTTIENKIPDSVKSEETEIKFDRTESNMEILRGVIETAECIRERRECQEAQEGEITEIAGATMHHGWIIDDVEGGDDSESDNEDEDDDED